jgi:tRNA (Thr-GGU) A37 N-methylase
MQPIGYDPSRIVSGAQHPRNNPDWPAVGIFAQRAKNRPNRIGSTICRLLRCEGTQVFVSVTRVIKGSRYILSIGWIRKISL